MNRISVIKPGFFSPLQAAADNSRIEFDIKNESLLTEEVPVSAVFIGDSITHRWELNAYFRSAEGVLVNRGIGGDVAEYAAKRFEADALQLRPRHVVLLIGVNDTFKLEASMLPSRQGWTKKEVMELVVGSIEFMAGQAAGYRQSLAICSLLPTDLANTEMCRERNETIILINRRLKDLARENDAVFVDYHPHFADTDGLTLRSGCSNDGIHPNAHGYRQMANILSRTLASSALVYPATAK